jgi:hypothetical protein
MQEESAGIDHRAKTYHNKGESREQRADNRQRQETSKSIYKAADRRQQTIGSGEQTTAG